MAAFDRLSIDERHILVLHHLEGPHAGGDRDPSSNPDRDREVPPVERSASPRTRTGGRGMSPSRPSLTDGAPDGCAPGDAHPVAGRSVSLAVDVLRSQSGPCHRAADGGHRLGIAAFRVLPEFPGPHRGLLLANDGGRRTRRWHRGDVSRGVGAGDIAFPSTPTYGPPAPGESAMGAPAILRGVGRWRCPDVDSSTSPGEGWRFPVKAGSRRATPRNDRARGARLSFGRRTARGWHSACSTMPPASTCLDRDGGDVKRLVELPRDARHRLPFAAGLDWSPDGRGSRTRTHTV